jgi:hypothetical protein
LGRLALQQSGKFSSFGYTDITHVNVAAGQTATLKLGAMGRAVTGKLLLPAAFRNSHGVYLRIDISGTSRNPPPPQMAANVQSQAGAIQDLWMQIWSTTPAGRQYILAHPTASEPLQYFPEVDDDYNLRVDNVTPGDYQMSINAQLIGVRRVLSSVLFTMPYIPGSVSDEPLVLPDIHVKPS